MPDPPSVVLASLQTSGNTTALYQTAGFQQRFNLTPDVPPILLRSSVIHPYRYDQQYPSDDQFLDLLCQVLTRNEILFLTPVYFGNHSSLLQLFLERCCDLDEAPQAHLRAVLATKSIALVTHAHTGLSGERALRKPTEAFCAYFGIQHLSWTHYVLNRQGWTVDHDERCV
ncbi:NAD(P)H-dependent oxidoreductase [Deinococcus arcticus]|uniref:NADPH-dependent FMN reductase-like domain-containing protein n=1 Tax=Deinococcus arcticus TaxID=2136176 RepID=A0A2T3W3R1_9DEIO|nr:NAD(P)H-dependent oxidoreductase [Deinococcus arcticus]PTA66538.1 hypothetical protein C8263_17270 [Deinococcus arcticus]